MFHTKLLVFFVLDKKKKKKVEKCEHLHINLTKCSKHIFLRYKSENLPLTTSLEGNVADQLFTITSGTSTKWQT